MNLQKRTLVLTIALVLAGTVFLAEQGCKKTRGKAAKDVAEKKSDSIAKIGAICGKCGQVIGGKLCCECYQPECPVESFIRTHAYPCIETRDQ